MGGMEAVEGERRELGPAVSEDGPTVSYIVTRVSTIHSFTAFHSSRHTHDLGLSVPLHVPAPHRQQCEGEGHSD